MSDWLKTRCGLARTPPVRRESRDLRRDPRTRDAKHELQMGGSYARAFASTALRQYPHNRDSRPDGLGDDVGFAERFEWLLTMIRTCPRTRAGSPSRTS